MAIESITATIPVTGQSYTDLRPTITAETIEEYREQLAEVGRLAGNDAFVQRMSQNKKGKERIITEQGDLYFDKEASRRDKINRVIKGHTVKLIFQASICHIFID